MQKDCTPTLVRLVLLIIANMSDQCAISSDGSLKDAADIQWYNDADDAVPISSASHSLASTFASLSAQSLDDLFSLRPPAKKVSGERHSSRVRKPSKRTTDPDNAEAPGNILEGVISGQKRKPGAIGTSRRVSRKVILSDSNDNTASNEVASQMELILKPNPTRTWTRRAPLKIMKT